MIHCLRLLLDHRVCVAAPTYRCGCLPHQRPHHPLPPQPPCQEDAKLLLLEGNTTLPRHSLPQHHHHLDRYLLVDSSTTNHSTDTPSPPSTRTPENVDMDANFFLGTTSHVRSVDHARVRVPCNRHSPIQHNRCSAEYGTDQSVQSLVLLLVWNVREGAEFVLSC